MWPALIIITFISVWNDFMGSLIFLGSENNLTLALAYFSHGFISSIHLHTLMTASLIVMLPSGFIFFTLQNYLMGHGLQRNEGIARPTAIPGRTQQGWPSGRESSAQTG